MDTLIRLAARFQALADPTRLKLLRFIGSEEPTASACVAHLQLSQPRIARHLKILVEAELLVARREGRFIRYGLASAGSAAVLSHAALTVLNRAGEEIPGRPAATPTPNPAESGARSWQPPGRSAATSPEPESPVHAPLEDFLL